MLKELNTLEENDKAAKRIKVAIIAGSMNIGGGEIMAAKLSTYIDSDKFSVKLFIIGKKQNNKIANLLDNSGIDYECLGLPNSFRFKSYIRFSNAMKMYNPDVVHVHLDASYSWIWSILHNTPLIATMHSDPFRRKSLRVKYVIKIKSLQNNLKIVGCSKITSKLFKECYRIDDRFVTTIYNPIDIDFYKSAKEEHDSINFVHIGRFHYIKNHEMLIRAFKKAFGSKQMNAKLYLAGDGPLLNEMKELVFSLGLQDDVVFLGQVDNIPQLLKSMDVFVLSSRSEACPISILEAMASGLPVISTKVGGVPELVTNNGILVESEDEHAFCEAMMELFCNNDLRAEYSRNALFNVLNFDKKAIIPQYEEEYRMLVKQ